MIQYLIANAIASFVPTSRVVVTKPKPVANVSTMVGSRKKPSLVPLCDVIDKHLDCGKPSNRSLFSTDVCRSYEQRQAANEFAYTGC
jgi:hypothetical protein